LSENKLRRKKEFHDAARNKVRARDLSQLQQADFRDVMSDTLRRKKLRRTALLGSAMLALVCMAIFAVARLFVA
jgi:uncharacterized membrane protein YcjF (UPF0283 family)